MKRLETHNKAKTKKTAVSTTLIIVSVVLLLVGIVLLLIDPIKRANRRRISSDALNEVEKKIISTDPSVEPVATYVVPRRGNEVEGEGYDFIAETEEDRPIFTIAANTLRMDHAIEFLRFITQ